MAKTKLRDAACISEVRERGGVGLICLSNTGETDVLWLVHPVCDGVRDRPELSVLGRYLTVTGQEHVLNSRTK